MLFQSDNQMQTNQQTRNLVSLSIAMYKGHHDMHSNKKSLSPWVCTRSDILQVSDHRWYILTNGSVACLWYMYTGRTILCKFQSPIPTHAFILNDSVPILTLSCSFSAICIGRSRTSTIVRPGHHLYKHWFRPYREAAPRDVMTVRPEHLRPDMFSQARIPKTRTPKSVCKRFGSKSMWKHVRWDCIWSGFVDCFQMTDS